MAKKIRLEILGLSSSQSQSSGSFALVLGETSGNRRLPIIIGMFEAQAIAIEIEKITPNRPMTHDLFKSFAYNFGFTVKEIMISDLKEGVFFAKIVCENNGQSVEIDARPSDAIAIGLRFGVEIYTNDDILTEAGIVFTDESEEEPVIEEEPDKPKEPEKPKKMSDYSNDRLNELLEEALVSEDYERAAQIRDELNRRN
ncbi:MAG: DUF151 domain-containing protein [Cyclobacteriaceae bacterium]|nr:DUF151 domain-containing protein [Cyclobacteriaceae bacterium]